MAILAPRPEGFVATGDYIYFSALNSESERELWRSDGTAGGTEQVTNLRGVKGSYPENLTVIDGELLFSALTDIGERSLLHLGGTAAQPQLTPAGYDAGATLVEGLLTPFAGKLAFVVEETRLTVLNIYDPQSGNSQRLWRRQEPLLEIHDAGAFLLVRNSRGAWYRLPADANTLRPLEGEMGALVAVVPEPAGTSLLIDQQAYLWRLDSAGELHFLTDLAGTN